MKYAFLATLTIAVLFSCTSKKIESSPAKKQSLDSLLSDFYEDYLKFSPLDASMIGDNRFDDLLPNTITTEYRTRTKDLYEGYKSRLEEFVRDSLSENDRMSYDVLCGNAVWPLKGCSSKTI